MSLIKPRSPIVLYRDLKKINFGDGMNVKIYTTNSCPACMMAKMFLRENNIEFEEINLDEHPEKIDELQEKAGRAVVPVLEVNGKIIVGFDKEKIKEALGI
jgi:glutaredoxin-like YruB-family protein